MSSMLKYIRIGLRIVSVYIQGSSPTYSTICPLHDEYTRYVTKVIYLIVEARDPRREVIVIVIVVINNNNNNNNSSG